MNGLQAATHATRHQIKHTGTTLPGGDQREPRGVGVRSTGHSPPNAAQSNLEQSLTVSEAMAEMMNAFQDSLVLAADPLGTLISAAFLVIAFIGWIINILNDKGNQAPPGNRPRPNRPPRPRDERLQSEIDLFLEEVSGRRQEASSIEVVEPAKPRPGTTGGGDKANGTRTRTLAERPRRQPISSESPKRANDPPADLGGSVRGRRSDRARSQLSEPVNQSSPSDVDLSVDAHLAQTGGQTSDAPSRVESPEAKRLKEGGYPPLRSLLRNPAGIRQAIVLAEILGRPKSLRD